MISNQYEEVLWAI